MDCIINIIKNGRQCRAASERFIPYQSEDPSLTIPTYQKERREMVNSRRRKRNDQLMTIKKSGPCALKILQSHMHRQIQV